MGSKNQLHYLIFSYNCVCVRDPLPLTFFGLFCGDFLYKCVCVSETLYQIYVAGTDLVKPVAFHPTDAKNLGTDIFARLVPMRAYEASSVYSERKAELLRSVTSSVSEKDEELE